MQDTALAQRNTMNAKAADRLAVAVEKACSLPGAPTYGWCDLAASAARMIVETPETTTVITAIVQRISHSNDVQLLDVGAAGMASDEAQLSLVRVLRGYRVRRFCEMKPTRKLAIARNTTTQSAATALDLRQWECCIDEALRDQDMRHVWPAAAMLGAAQSRRIMLVGIGVEAALAGEVETSIALYLPIFTRSIARRAQRAFGAATPQVLTRREAEVLMLLTRGLTVQRIASRLDRSPHTIHDYVKTLHRKLGASSRGELVSRVLGGLGVAEEAA